MKMKILRPLLVLGVMVTASFSYCKKDSPPIPACIQAKIDSIKTSSKRNPPAEVHEWIYNGGKVYLFNAASPSDFVRLLDENCKYICSPSGGPLQYGDSLCPGFYQDARYIGMIFRDDR